MVRAPTPMPASHLELLVSISMLKMQLIHIPSSHQHGNVIGTGLQATTKKIHNSADDNGQSSTEMVTTLYTG